MRTQTDPTWLVAGAGRVGRTVASLLARRGRLGGVWVRHSEGLAGLHRLPPEVPCVVGDGVLPEVDRVVLAVPDGAVRAVVGRFPAPWREAPTRTWLHVSGASGPELLEGLGIGGSVGACHPLLSFQGDAADDGRLAGALFALDGDGQALEAGRELAELAGGIPVRIEGPEQRAAYHLAATLASNGIYALLWTAAGILERAGLGAPELGPGMARLAVHSALASQERGPVAGATGPVVRGDVSTVRRHLAALEGASADTTALYRGMSRVLVEVAERQGLRPGQAAALRVVLDAGYGDGLSDPT